MASQHTHLRAIVTRDGAAILDTKAGRISTLNASGAYVWQALEHGDELETIAEGLSRQTGEPTETVKRDLVEFIEALKKQNLLLS